MSGMTLQAQAAYPGDVVIENRRHMPTRWWIFETYTSRSGETAYVLRNDSYKDSYEPVYRQILESELIEGYRLLRPNNTYLQPRLLQGVLA